jgi:hypothetical protein
MRSLRFSVLPLLLVACGPSATKPVVVKAPTAPSPTKAAGKVESPARWALHATRLGNLHARLDLGSAILYGGDGGERWLDKRDGSPPMPANALVPEPIVGIAKLGKGVLLVGASGAVYPADDPLGAPGAKRTPPTTMRSATAGRAAIVAIADGGLMRSADGGATWTKIDLPGAAGTLVQVAMNDGGLGLALAAPQRAWATDDDGATWKSITTPGVGARGVVHDVNGDLMLEGVEASGLLRGSPLRLERVARAPKSDGYDLGVAPTAAILSYAKAVMNGRGALVADRYLEAIAEPDDPTRWRVAYGKLGERLEAKKVAELNGCERVWAAGDVTSLYLACDDRGGKTGGALGKAKSYDRASIRIYRSDDEGKTWKDDGNTGSRRADVGHVWLAPDRTLIIDGACKRLRNTDCYDSPPLVRPGGGKNFAKLNVRPGRVTQVSSLAFAPQGQSAFALARSASGPLALLISKNGGKDFRAVALPTVAAADANLPALSAARAEPGTVSVDPSGAVSATASVSGEWLVYTSKDDGQTIEGHRFPHRVDGVSMSGRNGLGWARDGRAWETVDGGANWTPVTGPAFSDAAPGDRAVVCNAYGCLIGDRAVRVGWGGAAIAPKAAIDPTSTKILARAPLACSVEGEWKPLGALISAPSAYDAEVATTTRWLAIRHDTTKGSVAVVLGKTGAKGIETKEVSLFGPAGKDTATAVLPQIEGAAAIRYVFKRETVNVKEDKDSKDKKAKTTSGPIVEGQKVDVEVAWYVASTGVVHRATIKSAGPLDPRDVVGGGKDAAGANVGLLSIAQGGVHVRPFGTKPESPLWFVREGGKIDRLPWPELPTKDVGGSPLPLRIDAVRAAGRTVLIGMIGTQLLTAWANEAGSGWDTRTWGLWPEAKGGPDASWDFSYVAGSAGAPRPAIVVQWPGGAGVGPVAWGVPLKGVEADPSEAIAMPTQKTPGDSEPACTATDTAPRVVTPFSIGTRHPITVTGDVGEQVLATSSAVLRGDGKTACVLAYEAKPIARAKSDKVKPGDEGAYSAVIPWADREHAFLFRSAVNGDTSVRALKCTAGKEPPSGLAGVEGFAER